MKLHELSIKRPVAVIMIILMFLVIGLYSLTMLPMEMMPKMDMSMAIVLTTYSNVGSEEVESLVTKNVESAISSVSGIDSMTEIRLILTVTQSPPRSLAKLLPRKSTLIPKSCISQPPFQKVGKDGNRKQYNQIEDNKHQQGFVGFVVQTD